MDIVRLTDYSGVEAAKAKVCTIHARQCRCVAKTIRCWGAEVRHAMQYQVTAYALAIQNAALGVVPVGHNAFAKPKRRQKTCHWR